MKDVEPRPDRFLVDEKVYARPMTGNPNQTSIGSRTLLAGMAMLPLAGALRRNRAGSSSA